MAKHKRKARALSDAAEARIQAGIAADPDNPERRLFVAGSAPVDSRGYRAGLTRASDPASSARFDSVLAELAQRVALDLTHPLSSYSQTAADLVKRHRYATGQAVAQFEDFALSLIEALHALHQDVLVVVDLDRRLSFHY